MNITESVFYSYVPAATNPEGYGVFEMMQDHLAIGTEMTRYVLGNELMTLIGAAQENELDQYHHLCSPVIRYICLYAFDRAIPSLDLVLTPTGFGVVSNENVAPASADRVERLRTSVRKMRDSALDDLLEELRGVECWHDTYEAKKYFSSLIWSGKFMAHFGYPNEGRTKMMELDYQIARCERELIHLISPQQHDALTAAIRHRQTTPVITDAIKLCRSYIYALFELRAKDVMTARNALLYFLEKNIDAFPEYGGSSAFEANNFKKYENSKDDASFFFG